MKNPDLSIVDRDWPAEDLEHVDACPFCDSKKRQLEHHDVRDWSFYNAPGGWNYWECLNCSSLYLNPRPSKLSIGKAYSRYYTHDVAAMSFVKKMINKLKNECISSQLHVSLDPRFNLPKILNFFLILFRPLFIIPFGLNCLTEMPKGRLIDIGCGSGEMLRLAKSIGWDAQGLEVDAEAVTFARRQGLNVIHGSVDQLQLIEGKFDCVVCSHVLEHVHEPLKLLKGMTGLLNTGGALIISLPNADSHVRHKFGKFWRGLEAPRHISIPTLNKLVSLLKDLGYVDIQQKNTFYVTVPESNMIRRRSRKVAPLDIFLLKMRQLFSFNKNSNSDFIQIVAKLNSHI